MNMTVINGLNRMFEMVNCTPMDRFMPHIQSMKDLVWEEEYPSDSMLRASVYASESGIESTFTSVWIQAKALETILEVLVMEPTNDILAWLGLDHHITKTIKSNCPL